MANLNACHFIGTLTRNPETKTLPSGTTVCEFSIAVNRTWTKDGTKQEEVAFLEFTAFGKVAEIIGKYCKKGESHYFGARAKQDTWEDKESGKKRSKIHFIVEDMQLLPNTKQEPSEQAWQSASPSAEDGDDIPF